MSNSLIILLYKGELIDFFNILDSYHIVIITQLINMEIAEALNEYCREKKICFIYTAQLGLSSFLFKDFGYDFTVENANGKELQKYFIKSITNSCPGVVEIDPVEYYKNDGKKIKKYLKLSTGDLVTFNNVKGMTELNDTPPRPIRVLSKTKFTIEDTSKFQEFSGSGVVEEVKIPYPVEYMPLTEAKDFIYNFDEDLDNNFNCEIISDENAVDEENEFPWEKLLFYNQNETLKNKSNELMHLGILTLHEFFKIHQFLPHYNEQKEINECIEISDLIFSEAKKENKKWVKTLEKINKIFLEKIFKYSDFYFYPITNFLGGVFSQEILKYIGLYRPAAHQWMFFNFGELINEGILNQDFKNIIMDEEFKRNKELYVLFGKEKLNEIKSTNILIIGFDDTTFEILRILFVLDLCNQNNNNINILGDNKAEIEEKINNLKINDKFSDLNVISEKINIKENISEKEWWKKSVIIIDTLSYKYNQKEKIYIIKNCEKDNKILISINTNKTLGYYELILPKKILRYYNLGKNNSFSSKEDMENTPEGESKEKNIKQDLIYTMDDALKWSQSFFEDNFRNNIRYLNELINKSDSEEETKKYMDDLISKINDNEKSLKLIINFKKLISLKLGLTFELIVFHSIELFQEIFEFSVDEILQKYPEDLIEQGSGKNFCSRKKIIPSKILFDIKNEEHYKLIYYFTYFFCHILEMEGIEEKMKEIKKIGEKYEFKKYDLTILKKANNKEFFDIQKNSVIKFLGDILKINKLAFKEIDINYYENIANTENFKKMNKQLKLVMFAANLKLNNFGIQIINKNNALFQLLKINEVFPTVSSAISGLTILQVFNMFNDLEFIGFIKSVKEGQLKDEKENEEEKINENKINIIKDDESNNVSFYKNAAFNFASNIYIFYDIFSCS